MDDDLKKLRKLVKLMRREGVLHLKAGGTELSIAPVAFELDPPKRMKSGPLVSDLATDDPVAAQEAMLFWSSPGMTGQGVN